VGQGDSHGGDGTVLVHFLDFQPGPTLPKLANLANFANFANFANPLTLVQGAAAARERDASTDEYHIGAAGGGPTHLSPFAHSLLAMLTPCRHHANTMPTLAYTMLTPMELQAIRKHDSLQNSLKALAININLTLL
jgi:hypothetical protein